MKCKCLPNSPFLWEQNPRPSLLSKDVSFRPKNVKTNASLTKEENILAYQEFSIRKRTNWHIKPTLNKHEV